MTKVDKKATFISLVAYSLKEELKKIGYETIVRKAGDNAYDIHIRGFRKKQKHIINIFKCHYRAEDIPAYYIYFESQKIDRRYVAWKSEELLIEDPEFEMPNTIEITETIDKFIDCMVKIDKLGSEADALFKGKSLLSSVYGK